MSDESLIHVKLEYKESVGFKKELLSTEMNLLKIAKNVEKYKILREKELEKKLILQKKMRSIITNMRNLKTTLPRLNIPKILKKDTETEETTKKKTSKHKNDDLEFQLKEIQEKLRAIGG